MKASISAKELEEASVKVLEKLGCKFYTNRTIEITEFEVIEPVSIIVRISKTLGGHQFTRFGTLFASLPDTGSHREMSNMEIVLPERSTSASQIAARFVQDLLDVLPKKPWQGLGTSETINTRADWNSWLRKRRPRNSAPGSWEGRFRAWC